MRVLFLGDIVGRAGREALNRHLSKINLDNEIDSQLLMEKMLQEDLV